ncbi:hypothetical protein VNO80_27292 [Phaseolus coccineus]|uniref:Dolichyl-diphosphooligosaccharide--protein glycosyltransferase subunit 2 n=1 Tax=Phaseolus coccineus TaxID=3886 RepID=A0AAN9QL68_PHACN
MLRVFEIIGFEEKKNHVSGKTCQKVLENLDSASPLKDLFYALKVNNILKCDVIREALKATVHDASTLLDIYYSTGGLILIKVVLWLLLLHTVISEVYTTGFSYWNP